ncbi:MAG: T9SS type A sorting domain-containing protein [Saprospiraceae bacterium]|nr:T9SS type A sorting domain-containing protein [Saprospiraceae bacterium]
MKGKITAWMLSMALLTTMNQAKSQIVLNEIGSDGRIEIKNIGSTGVNVLGYFVCNGAVCYQLSQLGIICPFPPATINPLAPGSILVGESDLVELDGGEIALFSSSNTTDPLALVDYVQWGSSGHPNESLATTAGIWPTGGFTAAIPADGSLEYDGSGNEVADWALAFSPSPCAENGSGCQVIAGTIETDDPTLVCVNDSIADYVFVSFSGNLSPSWYFVATDSVGTIQDYVPESTSLNFEGAPTGTSFIHLLSYEGQLIGLEIGGKLDDVQGCIDLSDNTIEITKVGCVSGTHEWEQELAQLVLSPNPAGQVLHLSNLPITKGEGLTFGVYNAFGKLALPPVTVHAVNEDILIDTDQLQPGVYFLMISSHGSLVVRKFIKL